MPDYRIVIVDPDVAHAKEIARNIEARAKAQIVVSMAPPEQARLFRHIDSTVRASIGRPKQAGDVHAERVSSDCPDGLPNCRNCGDPEHAEACANAGHCPYCGTRHGIAPTRILVANGYRLEAL